MENNIHITALVPYRFYPPNMGGQKAIALFYEYLSVVLNVSVAGTKNNEVPSAVGYKLLHVLPNAITRYVDPRLLFRTKKIIRENNSSHLVLEHPYFGWLGMALKKITNVKLIVRSHNIESMRFKSTGKWWWRVLWQYERIVHRHADMSFFITDEDMQFAIRHFKLQRSKCVVITYGTSQNENPAIAAKMHARDQLQNKYGIRPGEKILLFNGTLNYKPNSDALNVILHQINPLLQKNAGFEYRIIICGSNLPSAYNKLEDYRQEGIIYAGFVEDISVYFLGADIFINPVIDGGGIKTKLVEALAADMCCVSTVSGSIGVPESTTGNKMLVTADGNWENFANKIIEANTEEHTPALFYHHFYWANIIRKAARLITDNPTENI